ncbi:MAG: SWIM zinc finger family protein [Micropruina sp.]|nr:SWIM zinc finger family protein [Micropruina sp.]
MVRGQDLPDRDRLRRPSGQLRASCSCPVGFACKHSAAVLVVLRRQARQPQLADWQQALATVVGAEPRPDRTSVPLALELTRNPGGITLRPLMWGKSGRWIRSGITWDSLRDPSRTPYNETHRRALAAIRRGQRAPEWQYYGSRTEVLELGQLAPEVWPALREALACGVELISAPRSPVTLVEEPARVLTRLSRSEAGLTLTTRVLVGDQDYSVPYSNLLGTPPHGVVIPADHGVLIAGFEEPLRPSVQAMLLRHPKLAIPAEDVPTFASGHLSALRQKVPVEVDPDVELPTPEPPGLLLRVGFEPGHVTTLEWSFTYAVGAVKSSFRLDDSDVEQAPREASAEAALLDELPDGPWPRFGSRPLSGRVTGPASASFVSDGLPLLREHPRVVVVVDGEPPSYRLSEAAPVVSLAVTDPAAGTDWFNLDVTISIDGESIDFRELFTAVATGQSHLILESGTWFSLDHPELDQLRLLMAEAAALQERGRPGCGFVRACRAVGRTGHPRGGGRAVRDVAGRRRRLARSRLPADHSGAGESDRHPSPVSAGRF